MGKARVLVELRPSRNLLDSEFEGYKLSLDPLPVHRLELASHVDHVYPGDDQYSFLHTKVFGLHNQLFSDPWTENRIYFVDERWKVFTTNHETDALSLCEVWEIPSHHERRSGHYNVSMHFASSDLAVACDGAGTLHVVNTEDRSFSNKTWEAVYSCEPIGTQQPFVILHSQYYCGELHCLLLHVREEVTPESGGDSEESERKSKFVSVIDWVTIEGEKESWSVKSLRQIVGEGSIDYAALEPSCCAVFIASDRHLKFVSDSENPIEEKLEQSTVDTKPQVKYSWLQTVDDITLLLPVPSEVVKADINVTVTPLTLEISFQSNTVMKGNFHQRIDCNLTSWTFSPGKLEVGLSKSETGVVWPELLVGDKQGEEILDPAFVEEVHQRLAHLCSEKEETAASGIAPAFNSQQLEDCDALPRDTAVLQRLDAKDHTISHQVNLGGHQWLFNASLQSGVPPAVCIRHDVDACLWQLEEVNRDTDVLPITHTGTFLAFGYVQASKQQRKFSVCSPDMSFVAICDTSRHVYIYHQPGTVGSDLRNRATGRRVGQIARQRIVQIEDHTQILGCQATKSHVYLLTSNSLSKLILG